MKVRTTVVLDEIIIRKIQSERKNVSSFVNETLRKSLFGERESMLGVFKGKVSGADKIEDDD